MLPVSLAAQTMTFHLLTNRMQRRRREAAQSCREPEHFDAESGAGFIKMNS
jgi:hypothetical protein